MLGEKGDLFFGSDSPLSCDLRKTIEPVSPVLINALDKLSDVDREHSIIVTLIVFELVQDGLISSEYSDLVRDLLVAFLFHDIGKSDIRMPDANEILRPTDVAQLHHHPKASFNLLRNSGEPVAGAIAVAHHEFQNQPYRRSLNRGDYHGPNKRRPNVRTRNLSEVLALIDKFDALTNPRRTYRTPDEYVACAEKLFANPFFNHGGFIDRIIEKLPVIIIRILTRNRYVKYCAD